MWSPGGDWQVEPGPHNRIRGRVGGKEIYGYAYGCMLPFSGQQQLCAYSSRLPFRGGLAAPDGAARRVIAGAQQQGNHRRDPGWGGR